MSEPTYKDRQKEIKRLRRLRHRCFLPQVHGTRTYFPSGDKYRVMADGSYRKITEET